MILTMQKYFFILSVFILFACSDDDDLGVEVELKYYEGSQVSSDFPYVDSGSNIVFHRFFKAEDDPMIADDEYSEDFLFEVSTGSNSFNIEGEQLRNQRVLLNQYCFCAPYDFIELIDGFVRGDKIGNNWTVDANIVYRLGYINVEDNDTVFFDNQVQNFTGLFRAAERP